MSPILVRPVREQLEHDRIVRLLQAKSRRRYDALANPGNEQNAPIKVGAGALYPDVLLYSQGRGHRLQAILEIETGESVNHLEALSQWAAFSRQRVEFHLYVPANMVDVARRLCQDNQVTVNEVWSYHLVGDQFRFTLMHRARHAAPAARRPAARRPTSSGGARRSASSAARPASSGSARPASSRSPRPASSGSAKKPVSRPVKSGRAAKPVRKTRPKKRR